MLVVVNVICATQVPTPTLSVHTRVCVCVCVHVIAFPAIALHFLHDCNGSLRRRELAEETGGKKNNKTLKTWSKLKEIHRLKQKKKINLLSPSVSLPPRHFLWALSFVCVHKAILKSYSFVYVIFMVCGSFLIKWNKKRTTFSCDCLHHPHF